MKVTGFDHLVLTVCSIEETVAFYERALGFRTEVFGAGRIALHFGDCKLNLHGPDSAIGLKAVAPAPGSVDVCFLVEDVSEAERHLRSIGVEVIEGPGERAGARGPMTSIYLRDPDENLIELSTYKD